MGSELTCHRFLEVIPGTSIRYTEFHHIKNGFKKASLLLLVIDTSCTLEKEDILN